MQPKHNKQLVPFAKRLRKEMTKEERHLWYDFLRIYPVRFSRQKVLGKYIADFYSAEAKLVIELDGSQHFEEVNTEKDTERTTFLDVLDYLNTNSIALVGAVHDFTCPSSGKNYMYFPIRTL